MHEKMNLLMELQEVDLELNSIEATRQGHRDELAAFEADAARVQAMLDELNAELEVLRQDEAKLQQDLLKERDNIVRVEKRLPEIQTQKEYVAVLKEIDMAKKANRDLDERLQAKLQEIASLEQDQQEKAGELAKIQENAAARGAELNQLLADTDSVLGQRRQTRDKLAADVPSSLLRKYQQLFQRRGGLALALARNGACLGCNMQLPPQQFNSLLRTGDLQSCPHCNRLLYAEQDV